MERRCLYSDQNDDRRCLLLVGGANDGLHPSSMAREGDTKHGKLVLHLGARKE